MQYVPLIERRGIEKGVQQTSERIALRYLAEKFGELNAATIAAIKQLPVERLTALSDAMFDFKTADELAAWLKEHATEASAVRH